MTLTTTPLVAYLNWGRWVADCPCNSGLLIGNGSGVYRCRDCGERSQVRMPVEWQEAERLCRNRPPKHRNWREDETIAGLIAENIMHRVPGAPDWRK